MDRDWRQWRMQQLSLCGMMSNATILLVDRTLPQLNTPQIIHIEHPTFTAHFSESTFTLQTLNIHGCRDLLLRSRLL